MKRITKIRVGPLEVTRRKAENLTRVPKNYGQHVQESWFQEHLAWLLQKDTMGQDTFLLGPPGALRRQLALAYCELTNREYEIVSLSRETTDSDLKQRREIIDGGTAVYVDQAPVKAALNGSVLILDGIEKAERNVLPILNNLLENREMGLSDGRFLVAPERYDELVANSSFCESNAGGLERVHPDFQIIALGLPVPSFPGFPLDPPLRSRFQARYISNPTPRDQLNSLIRIEDHVFSKQSDMLNEKHISGDEKRKERLLGASRFITMSETIESLRADDGPLASKSTLHIPYETIRYASSYLRLFPDTPPLSALATSGWPYKLFDVDSTQSVVLERAITQTFETTTKSPYIFLNAEVSDVDDGSMRLVFSNKHAKKNYAVNYCARSLMTVVSDKAPSKSPTQGSYSNREANTETFTAVPEVQQAITELAQGYALHRDLCLVGPSGSGKSCISRRFCEDIHQSSLLVNCYRDMSARDLLLKRTTDKVGSTIWEMSPLLQGAINGNVVILDGIHRLESDTLSVLQSLLTHREIDLADGRRLLRHDRFDRAHKRDLQDGKLPADALRIHPAFRVIALATPPTRNGNGEEDWVNAEVLTMFHFVQLLKPSRESIVSILENLGPGTPSPNEKERMSKLLHVAQQLEGIYDVDKSVSLDGHAWDNSENSISIRQLKRIWQSSKGLRDFEIGPLIQRNLLTKFMPKVHQEAISTILVENGLLPHEEAATIKGSSRSPNASLKINNTNYEMGKIERDVRTGTVTIGATVMPVNDEKNYPHLIPNPEFFDIPAHVEYLQSMARSLKYGERWMLLIGNQGTGKNKLADRLLHLLQWPREYMQLHRDTTIQSLTTVPTIQDGIIEYEDSSLVKAVQNGHVLVVDEADKAPTEVVCILKSLIEDGQMMLSDGRQLLSKERINNNLKLRASSDVIEIHPNFKMMVLANRPGFPFLGNDFFREAGDCFACYVIENPPKQSQIELLKEYATHKIDGKLLVSEFIIEKIVDVFVDLHQLYEDGILLYPYSTREMVHIIKHMSKFPKQGISSAVSNVLDFDVCDQHILEELTSIFKKHGIPLLLKVGHSASTVFETKGDLNGHLQNSPRINLSDVRSMRFDNDQKFFEEGFLSIDFSSAVPHIPVIESDLETRNVDFQFGKEKPTTPTTLSKASSVFSEEKQSFSLDIEGSIAKKIASVSTNLVDVLLSKPAGILRMNFTDGVGKFTDISSQYSHGVNYGIGRYGGKWIFHALNDGVVINRKDDINGGAKIAGLLPESFFGKPTSRITWMDTRRRINENRLILAAEDSLGKDGMLYCHEGSKLLQIDMSADDTRQIKSKEFMLPFSISQVFPLGTSEVILVKADDESMHYAKLVKGSLRQYPLKFVPKNEASDKAGDNFCLSQSIRIRSINRFEDGLQVNDSYVIPKGSIFIHGVSTDTGEPVNFVAESLLPTDNGGDIETPGPASLYTISTNNSKLINSKSDYIKTIFNGKKAVIAFEDPLWPVLQIMDFEKGTMQQVQLQGNFGIENISTRDEGSGKVVDISFIQCSKETDGPDGNEVIAVEEDDIAVLYDDGTVRIIGTNQEMIMNDLSNFRDMMGNVEEDSTDFCLPDRIELIQTDEFDNVDSVFNLSSDGDEILFQENMPSVNDAGKSDNVSTGKSGESDNSGAGGGAGGGSGSGSGSGSGGMGGFGSGGSGGGTGGGGGGSGGDLASNSMGGYTHVSMNNLSSIDLDTEELLRFIEASMPKEPGNKDTIASPKSSSGGRESGTRIYSKLVSQVKNEINQMRVILESAEAKENEREWLRGQLQGDLDDNRLVDSVTGEKRVYRKRGTPDRKHGLYQGKPKRIVFAVDLSASMARMNNWDGRLDRMVMCIVMFMEALQGFSHKFDYSVVGHSGTGPDIPIIDFGKPPISHEDRVRVMETLYSSSRGATTGDSSLLAAQMAIKASVKEKGDDYLVFLFSDANLGRYGISPDHMTQALTSRKDVQGHAIFLAEESAAEWLTKEMPLGRGYVAMEMSDLPKIVKEIFQHAAYAD